MTDRTANESDLWDEWQASERAKQAERPIWSEDYTCGCGIYVHPARRIGLSMGQAFHISDCPYAAPPADDEAVRLLRKARKMWVDDDSITAEEIDAYLATSLRSTNETLSS